MIFASKIFSRIRYYLGVFLINDFNGLKFGFVIAGEIDIKIDYFDLLENTIITSHLF